MIAINYSTRQPDTQYRKRLAFALQGAYSGHQYSSPAVSDAIRDFVRNARYRGLTLDWVLVAIQDVIDAGMLPSLCDRDRLAFSKPMLRLAAEAYQHCYDAAEPHELSRGESIAATGTRPSADARMR